MPRLKSFDIVASAGGSLHRIAKLRFARDGSIYVFFPGFAHTDGLACRVFLRAANGATANFDLAESGFLTTHLVKYAHHPDGEAHFSQERKVRTVIRRKSVPLNEHRGHLFTIQLQDVLSFQPISVPATTHVTIAVPEHTQALKITAWRYDNSHLDSPGTNLLSAPQVRLAIDNGLMRSGVFVAPPEGMPFDDVLMFLAVEGIPLFNTEKGAQLLFVGGFDHHKTAMNLSRDTEFLAFAYPCSNYERLRSFVPSMDFRNGKGTSNG